MKLHRVLLTIPVFGLFLTFGCQQQNTGNLAVNTVAAVNSKSDSETRIISEAFKNYWYDGTAEITSFRLSQERYGELREGTAVTVFVTEDFLPEKQVKANSYSEENIPVLKLNTTKKFITGIYPYSIMTSTFTPVNNKKHALKVSNSVQEWCGQVYIQLNNRKDFDIMAYSYFEGEADKSISLEKTWLEDELWSLIRINPEELPTGELSVIPSFESMRLRHKEITAYPAVASLKKGDALSIYEIKYPSLQRDIIIYFSSSFPFEIEKWQEINVGWSNDTTRLKTTAVKMQRIKSAYWGKNSNKDQVLRDSLGL